MPSVTATIDHVLRYFFIGAIATLLVLAPPGPGWHDRVDCALKKLATPAAVVAIAIGGNLLYGLHRVLFYEVLYRSVLISVFWPKERRWWPYGTAPESELRLEARASKLPSGRERFVGWSSEIHVLYATIEVALFTLVLWPRWNVGCGWWWFSIFGLLVVGALVWAWDRHELLVIRHLASNGFPD